MTRPVRSGEQPLPEVGIAAVTITGGGAATPISTPDRVIGSWTWTGRQLDLAPFVVLGVLAVVAGGLLAAVIAPAPTEHAMWAVAYLVLVWGLAQVGLGMGQALCARHLSTAVVVAQVTGWNVGCAAVVIGTSGGVPAVADVGAALVVVTLVLFAGGLTGGTARRRIGAPFWVRVGYGLLITVLLLSIPVGLVLLRLRT